MALITRIISGGQVGADVAGLRAGQLLAIETGGWMPQGFRTIQGDRPDRAEIFGVQEHECRGYPPRTRQNVQESDGTVRFAVNFTSPGEICTMNAIREFDKPFFDVRIDNPRGRIGTMNLISMRQWLIDHDISVLNVAGNARLDIEDTVESFLVRTITQHNRNEHGRIASEAIAAAARAADNSALAEVARNLSEDFEDEDVPF